MNPIAAELDQNLSGLTAEPDGEGIFWTGGYHDEPLYGPRVRLEQQEEGGVVVIFPDTAHCRIDFPELEDECVITRGGDLYAIRIDAYRSKDLTVDVDGKSYVPNPEDGLRVIFPNPVKPLTLKINDKIEMIIAPDGTLSIPIGKDRQVQVGNIVFKGT